VIVRTILAVVLAVALVGASQSAMESAARERTATGIEADVDRFVDRARSLADTEDAVAGPGARRIVTIRVPPRTRTSAEIERLVVHPSVDGGTAPSAANASAVTWTIAGGDRQGRILEDVHLVTEDGGGLELREPGRHRVRLALRGTNADPRIHVSRYGNRGDDDD